MPFREFRPYHFVTFLISTFISIEVRLSKAQEHFDVELMSLIENPAQATLELLAEEVYKNLIAKSNSKNNYRINEQMSIWISPTPVTIKMRIFCLPYAGGVSANVFSR